MTADADAVVIGSGPNGLTAANTLVDAGWSVLVCEEQPDLGGAVRSAPGPAPGFTRDRYSAFYPMAAGSQVVARMRLADHGLRWSHAPTVLAHPRPDGRSAVLSRDVDVTAAALDADAPGDGDVWRDLVARWRHLAGPMMDALLGPFPPVGAAVRLLGRIGVPGALSFARLALSGAAPLAEELFDGTDAGLLLAGSALHADLTPDEAASAIFGWILTMHGATVGWPVPQGGAGRLTEAMAARLVARGGEVRCSSGVERVLVRGGRAVGVRLAGGEEVTARRAVLAAVPAWEVYGRLVPEEDLPSRGRAVRRLEPDPTVVKVDWALSAPVPWTAPGAVGAGTVHVGHGEAGSPPVDALRRYAGQVLRGDVPDKPFVLMGQMTTADPSRSPAGTESAWGYTHVPRHPRRDAGPDGIGGGWTDSDAQVVADRMTARVEECAPGFSDRVLARTVELVGAPGRRSGIGAGTVGGGTAALASQLVFRPIPGLGLPSTPVAGLFLASSSAHPGGGGHGAPGHNAARAALRADGRAGRVLAGVLAGAESRLQGPGRGPLP